VRYIPGTRAVSSRRQTALSALQTEILAFRIAPDVKAVLHEAAQREHRNLANMLKVMISSHASGSVRACFGSRAVQGTRDDQLGAGRRF
jgi:hypothetical protein